MRPETIAANDKLAATCRVPRPTPLCASMQGIEEHRRERGLQFMRNICAWRSDESTTLRSRKSFANQLVEDGTLIRKPEQQLEPVKPGARTCLDFDVQNHPFAAAIRRASRGRRLRLPLSASPFAGCYPFTHCSWHDVSLTRSDVDNATDHSTVRFQNGELVPELLSVRSRDSAATGVSRLRLPLRWRSQFACLRRLMSVPLRINCCF